jgi:ABC-type bacteriocin/lantibiotic exporter with double-glycine peptidase domain
MTSLPKFNNPKDVSIDRLEPVERMIKIMQKSGVKAFENCGEWESCLCALVLALEPRCRTYRFLETLPYERDSYDDKDVLNTLARLGYFSRQIPVSIDTMDKRLFPSLFIQKDGSPVILIAQEDDERVKVYRNHALTYLYKNQLAGGQARAIIFERYDENKPATSKFIRAGTNYGWFRALLGRFKGTFAQILTCGLVINTISLTTPLMIMLVYNRVIATGTMDVLPMVLFGMFLAASFEIVLRALRTRGLSWIAARMDNIVGNEIFAHLIGLPPALIERASVAAQIARIKTFESIRDFFCSSVFLSMIEMPFVIIAALAIYFVAGNLVFVPLSMGLAYAALFYITYKYVKTSIRIAAKTSSARQQFTIEAFEKIRGVRAYGLTNLWERKFRDLSGKEMMAHFHLNFLGMVGETLGNALTVLSAVLTVSFGAHMIWAGELTTGGLVATMILVWRVITPFYSICTMIPRMEQIRQSIIQVNTLMDLDTEEKTAGGASILAAIKGNINFNNVALRYQDTNEDVFNAVTFSARAGDLVVITGENGSGKSSILKIIKGLYIPTAGAVQIDGFDIRQLNPASLRKQIAYVPQQYDFFEGSIIDNLRLCNPIATEDEIRLALDLAVAHEEIERLPDGIHTRITRYSVNALPANLTLRLSLARLYLHTAPILLIDEISNTILSGRAGKNLKDYLARNKGSRTCIMVTYREDFLKMADTIVLMQRGQSPVVGNPETMINIVLEAA